MDNKEIEKISNYIFLESTPQRADIAIVFGTRHNEVIDRTLGLYKNKLAEKILISGGTNRVTGENEAIRIKKLLVDKGVAEADIILETKSTTSLENVIFSKKLIDKKIGLNNINKIVAIVKHYHSRRALMTLKKHFPKHIKLIPVTYKIHGFDRYNWHHHEEGKKMVLAEWEKIPKYLAQGDIEEL
ncbi:MAG: YdcF family protein [Candidatus Komeilibacteria bacterium]